MLLSTMMKISTPAKVGIAAVVAAGLAIVLWPKKAKADEAAGGGTGGTKALTGENFNPNTSDSVSIQQIVDAGVELPLKVGESFWLRAPQGYVVTTIQTDGVELGRPSMTTAIDTGKGVGIIAIAPGKAKVTGTFAQDMNGTDEHAFEVPYAVSAA
jgi:hypothetical protein